MVTLDSLTCTVKAHFDEGLGLTIAVPGLFAYARTFASVLDRELEQTMLKHSCGSWLKPGMPLTCRTCHALTPYSFLEFQNFRLAFGQPSVEAILGHHADPLAAALLSASVLELDANLQALVKARAERSVRAFLEANFAAPRTYSI